MTADTLINDEIELHEIHHVSGVSLDSSFDEPIEPTSENTTYKFNQFSKLKGWNDHFSIFKDKYLHIEKNSKLKKKEGFWVDLSFIDPKPEKFIQLSIPWLMSCCITSLISGALIIFAWDKVILDSFPDAVPILAIGLAAVSVIFFILFIQHSKSTLHYYSRAGRINYLQLHHNSPNKHTFSNIITKIDEHISLSSISLNQADKSYAALELQEHRRLKEKGQISNEEYESAKSRILKLHNT